MSLNTTPQYYFKTELANGLRIVSEYMPHLRSVSLGLWVTVGSRHETRASSGMTHLIEHAVFKGTQHRSALEIAQSLESVGGYLDAFTSKEVTCFTAHILDEHLELALDVISDLVLNPTFPADELEKEKEVIISEINHTQETPDELIFDYFYQDIFPNHSLGFQIYGTTDTVSQFDAAALYAFMRQHFTPDRMIVAAAGNVDHEQLVALVARYFPTANQYQPYQSETPGWPAPARHSYHFKGSQVHLCLGSPGYAYTDAKKFGLLLINSFLGGGMSARLFQTVREKYGLVYGIYTFPDFFSDTGLFGVYAATQRKNSEKVIQLILTELQHLAQHGFADGDLTRLKVQLKGNLMLGLESAASRMDRLANMEIFLQDYFSLDQVLQDINRVTDQDIQAIASELFATENYVFTILTPDA